MLRFDTAEIVILPGRTPEGFLRVVGRAARTGILVRGDRRELVLPEELFDAASRATAQGIPLTNLHPHQRGEAPLVDATTAQRLQVGSVAGIPEPDGDWLSAPVMITDAAAIEDVEAGRVQLSCGYLAREEPTTPDLIARWGPHDVVQRERRYNHLALVDRARAGAGARLRLDDGSDVVIGSHQPERPMPKQIKIDGLTLNADDAAAEAIQQAHDRAVSKLAADLAAATARADREKARADAAEGETPMVKCSKCTDGKVIASCDSCGGAGMMPSEKTEKADGFGAWRDGIVKQRVAGRVKLETDARRILGAGAKLDAMGDDEIRKAVVLKVQPAAKLDGVSRDYLAARYDAAIEAPAPRVPPPAPPAPKNDNDDSPAARRAKWELAQRNAGNIAGKGN